MDTFKELVKVQHILDEVRSRYSTNDVLKDQQLEDEIYYVKHYIHTLYQTAYGPNNKEDK